MWTIQEKTNRDGSLGIMHIWDDRTMSIYTVPKEEGKPITVIYRDAKKNGKASMVECECIANKIFGKHIPLTCIQTSYPKDKDYIIYRIHIEIYPVITAYLYNDGRMRVSCTKRWKRIPLDENGKPIREPKIFAVPKEEEEKFEDFSDAIEAADVKVRRNSAQDNYMTKENKKVSIKLSVKDPREHWWKRRGKNNKNNYRLIMGK